MHRFLIILLTCLGLYIGLGFAFLALTNVGELNSQFPHVIYDFKTQKAHIEIKKERPKNWVYLGNISPIAVAAILLSEDDAFYQQNGFNWEQIWDSFQTNLEKGKFARGGSTITQQVAKNIYLSSQKTITRKIQEAILTVRLEKQVKKKRILEIYLNIAELGENLYGIGAASQFYFNKPASSLSAKEGAFLAILLPSPKKYSISFRKRELTRFASVGVKNILGKLLATHRISAEEYANSISTPLSFEQTALLQDSDNLENPTEEEETDASSVESEI